ncbi:MAG TPA: hypothetical protein VMT15_04370 [Bryobacteraceae bacterium]|nr:hypothetical protein [Bryobacteraceae bacterium]
MFDNTSVSITDAAGNTSVAPLFYLSPGQVDFQVPSNVTTGLAKVTINANGAIQTASNVPILAVAPALFTLNNAGLASAYAIRVSAGGTQSVQQIYTQDPATGLISPNPINMGSATDKVYLVLYGTGFDGATAATTTVTVNSLTAPVLYAGSSGTTPGLDQVNLQIPSSLAGKGNVNVQFSVSGVASNPLQVTIQ